MIHTVAETGSTNADLLGAAGDGAAEGDWLRAERQTAGRGRLDRIWESPPGNLYASTIVRLRDGDPPVPSLALVAAVALDEVAALHMRDGAGPLYIKWPNDLLAGAAKVAGILLERSGDAVVVGFGVNIAHVPEGLGRAVTSLAALGAVAEPGAFLIDLAAAFARWLQRWRGEGLAAVRQRWLKRAHPIGTALATGGMEGLFEGLTADGALRLRRADGEVVTIAAGDVALL